MIIDCTLCGHPLRTVDEGVCRYVEGWERNRSQGGTNAIHLRKTHDKWAHWRCVEAAVKGRLGQEELWEA